MNISCTNRCLTDTARRMNSNGIPYKHRVEHKCR